MIQNSKEEREYQQTQLRVSYHNSWSSNPIWKDALFKQVQSNLNANNLSQILSPLQIDTAVATDVLYNAPKLNRLFSTLLDVYELLPYHPDMAFDCMWRTLEVAIKMYVSDFDSHFTDKAANHYVHLRTEDYLLHICDSVFVKGGKADSNVLNLLNQWIENIPFSTLRFVTARMFLSNELQLIPDSDNVSKRTREELGTSLYEDLKLKYFTNNELSADNHRRIILFMRKLLRGEQMTIETTEGKTHTYKLSLQYRVVFICSSIMYSSRCCRFHGDYFSILKSERSNLNTYYGQYWMFTLCYYLFWVILHSSTEKYGLKPFFSLKEVHTSSAATMYNMLRVLENRI